MRSGDQRKPGKPPAARHAIYRSGGRDIPAVEKVHAEGGMAGRLVEYLREEIPRLMADRRTPGLNIALGSGGELIWEAGFGLADVAAARAMTPDTVFHSGSLGKTYTATAIMQLVDRSVIGLDDPINDHLDFRVANPLGDREVRIRDLLTHRSGLGGDSAGSRFLPPAPLAEHVAEEYSSDPRARKYGSRWVARVGERFVYSNLGLATLGLIVERVNPDGLGFDQYVQRHIIDALGMTASQFPSVQDRHHIRPDIWQQMSTGYSRMGAALIPTLPVHFGNYPAGSLVGKPADHLRLLLAMLQGGALAGHLLLAPESVRDMLTPASDEPIDRDARQGLVWRIGNVGQSIEKFHHPGGHMYGWTTQGVAWPRFGLALMVAVNQWSLPDKSNEIYSLEDMVDDWLGRQTPPIPAASDTARWAEIVSYVRGALYAFSYKVHCGIPDPIDEAALTEAVSHTRLQPEHASDWDPESFRRGVRDLEDAGCSYESIGRFWAGNAVVNCEELRAAYAYLGGAAGAASYSAGFLPPGLGPNGATARDRDDAHG